jgi:hypothetical protein
MAELHGGDGEMARSTQVLGVLVDIFAVVIERHLVVDLVSEARDATVETVFAQAIGPGEAAGSGLLPGSPSETFTHDRAPSIAGAQLSPR